MRCAVGCGHVHRGADVGLGVDTARGDPAHPTTGGQACGRGLRESTDPGGEWLTRPLIRRNGELVSTTWDVALGEVVTRFRDGVERDRDAVAVLGSGQQTNEAAYALGKFARGAVGTRNYDANTTLCMASAVAAYYDAFGSDAPPPTYDDVPAADTHLVWGANPAVAHPVLFRWIHRSADAGELLVVDPVETKTACAGDGHVAPEPGTDLALARGVLARLLETGGVDEAFVADHTEGFDVLRTVLPEPAAAAETAGVGLETLDRLVDALAGPTLLYWGMGVNQHVQGTDTAAALVDLCLASGNLGPGSGPFSLTGQANSMGTRICSSKGGWPGQRDFDDQESRELVAEEWGVPVERLPDETGPGPVGMFEDVADGPIEAVYAVATNPVAGAPDATAVEAALDETFLVVQDSHRTVTTQYADVVLPAATWGESDGTAINMERTVSRVRPATDLPGGVRTDLDLITAVGNALFDDLFETADPEAVFEEFAGLTAGTNADCSGLSYDRLAEELAVRWPAPDPETSVAYRYHDAGGDDPGETWTFPTPSGRARFAGGTGRELPESTDEAFPLVLNTAREADGYNTGVRSRASPEEPGPLVARIHPETVETHCNAVETDGGTAAVDRPAAAAECPEGLDAETRVRVESRRGSVAAWVNADEAIPEGMVWLPIHHPATNDLTVPATDPQSDEPNLKQCAVRLAAAADPAADPADD